MAKERFCKATVARYISNRIAVLEEKHGFQRSNGYVQVRGKGETANREYGEWRELLDLAERFELEV
jgi:hypothetical protein